MHVSFVHPAYLWAWLFVLVPILLHLFDWKRYRTVYFPHVAVLRQAQQRHKRQRRLRRRLILLCRVAAIVLLVAAFAQPVWRGEAAWPEADRAYYSIYLDNSYSMCAPYGGEGDALAAAGAAAARIVRQCPESAGIQILTNAFEGEERTFHAPADALYALSGVRPSPACRTLDEVTARMQAAAENQGVPPEAVRRIYISDFQTTLFDGRGGMPVGLSDGWRTDSTAHYLAFTPIPYDDWHIDSAALGQAVSPITGQGELQVWVSRSPSSGIRAERQLRLLTDGQAVPARRIALAPGERTCEVWPFRLGTPGCHAAELILEPDSVPYNNRLYLSLYRPACCRVLHVYGGQAPAAAARRLFGRDSAFVYEAVPFDRLDYAALSEADFVVAEGLSVWPSALTARLGDYLRSGGRLAVVPPSPAPASKTLSAPAQNPSAAAPSVAALDAWLQTLVGHPVYGRYATYAPRPRQIRAETAFRHPMWRKAVLSADGAASVRSAALADGTAVTEPLTVHGLYEMTSTETPLWPGFIEDYRVGNGRLYLFAAPWDAAYSTFTGHYGFVVCLLGMATEGGGLRPLYVADRRDGYEWPAASRGRDVGFGDWRLRRITDAGQGTVSGTQVFPLSVSEVGGERRIYGLETLPSGHYGLEDVAGRLIDLLALNVPASESWQTYRHPQIMTDTASAEAPALAVGRFPSGLRLVAADVPSGTPPVATASAAAAPAPSAAKKDLVATPPSVPLWKILLIFALLFMGAEAALLYRKPAV
ncbi:MAG: BatA domain-containing protein [Bacteroidales bacterium]|nr:BatA domain-containing protein [Bacteroidales bacterium]